MKLNIPVRFKNPWFWVGIGAIALSSVGLSPEMFTSWALVWEAIKSVLMNPFQLGCMLLGILAVFIDPTTAGISDSKQAMTYTSPKKDIK